MRKKQSSQPCIDNEIILKQDPSENENETEQKKKQNKQLKLNCHC